MKIKTLLKNPLTHAPALSVFSLILVLVTGPADVSTGALPRFQILIDVKNNLVGFQGDLTFDERLVSFEKQPVQPAGMTAGNWNVSGNVLEGTGPIRTLRISAYSNDIRPLNGSGTLFELKILRVNNSQSAILDWAAPPDSFIFIDADLMTQKPGRTISGRFHQSEKRK